MQMCPARFGGRRYDADDTMTGLFARTPSVNLEHVRQDLPFNIAQVGLSSPPPLSLSLSLSLSRLEANVIHTLM